MSISEHPPTVVSFGEDVLGRMVLAVEKVREHLQGVNMFLDGPEGRPRDAVHVLFAGEKVRQEYSAAAPDLSATGLHNSFNFLILSRSSL